MFKKKASKHLKKALFLIPVVVLFVFLLTSFEKYFAPYPLIDTKLAKGFSVENFEKIEKGWSRHEVVKLIGEGSQDGPFPIIVTAPFKPEGEKNCFSYSEDGKLVVWDFAWIAYGVCYDANNVVTRTYSEVITN
jgi:hypothetical protein